MEYIALVLCMAAIAGLAITIGLAWGLVRLVWEVIRPQPQIPPQILSRGEDHFLACGPADDPIVIKISPLAADRILRKARGEI